MNTGEHIAVLVGLAIVTFALTVLGLATVVLGVLVLALDAIYWPLLLGVVFVLGSAGAGWATYRRFLSLKERLERPRRRNHVFISYRTAEHFSDAERAAEILRGQGVEVYFARGDELPVIPSEHLAAFRIFGLFLLGGLDFDLQRALNRSDAMIYFLPAGSPRLTFWQNFKDRLDAFYSLLLFSCGMTPTFWRSVWHASLYGQYIEPAAFRKMFTLSSWQSWELAVGRQLGLAVVKVALTPVPGDEGDEELVSCRRQDFEIDFVEKVIPQMRRRVREELELRGPLPVIIVTAAAFVALRVAALLSAAAVAVYALLRALL